MEMLKKNRGFSLIELIVVIIILGIISIMAYIRWSSSATSLDAQTSIFASNLRYTQNLSMSKNERCRLIITLPGGYDTQDSLGNHQPIPGVAPNSTATLETGISFKELTGITSYTIIFDGKGVPYTGTGSGTEITSVATVVLQNTSGQTRTISISPKTGRISL